MQGFPLTSNQLSEIYFGLCNPVAFNNTRTSEPVLLPSSLVDDKKTFKANVKANIANF